MVTNRQSILVKFTKIMAIVYILFGVFFLAMPHVSFKISGATFVIEGLQKTLLGVFLLIYGSYRAYIAFQKPREKKEYGNLSILLLMFLPALASCGGSNKGAASANDTIVVCADESFKPIMQSGFEVFTNIDTLSTMKISFMPEYEAIQKLVDGKATLAIASRKLTDKENAVLNQRALYPRLTKIATDAIAVITHKSNPDSVLSIKEIRQILTGEVTNWNQLGKAQKNLPINVIFDNEQSGIVRYMIDTVCNGAKMEAKAYAMTYNTDVVEYISTHEGTIGFIGASWISDPSDSLHLSFHKKIQVIAVCPQDDKLSFESFKPYQAYMLNGMYPFTRDIYMINAEPNNGKATRFTNFMGGDKGQRIVLKSGILPAIAPTRTVHISNEY